MIKIVTIMAVNIIPLCKLILNLNKKLTKKILITGCAGFIGFNLSKYYLNKGHSVIGIDNLITGSENNISSLKKYSKFDFINHDIRKKLFLKTKIDFILHFACPASPKDYYLLPIFTLETGAIGTKNILDLAVEKNCKILVASTSEIYGNPEISPQKENYFGNVNTIGPRSVYDEAKRFQESITMAFHRKFGLDIKIARIFNTYGPGMRLDDGRVITNFISQILNNKNLTVYGDGSQTRSFCYIDDLVFGIDLLMRSDYNFPINLGNDDEISIMDLAKEIIALIGNNNEIKFKTIYEDDPEIRKPDLSLAKKILNWSPKVSRNDGVLRTFNFYKNFNKSL